MYYQTPVISEVLERTHKYQVPTNTKGTIPDIIKVLGRTPKYQRYHQLSDCSQSTLSPVDDWPHKRAEKPQQLVQTQRVWGDRHSNLNCIL